MMIASMNPVALRPRPQEHRTEPRIMVQMQGARDGNAKLKPTVFLPGAAQPALVGTDFSLSGKTRKA